MKALCVLAALWACSVGLAHDYVGVPGCGVTLVQHREALPAQTEISIKIAGWREGASHVTQAGQYGLFQTALGQYALVQTSSEKGGDEPRFVDGEAFTLSERPPIAVGEYAVFFFNHGNGDEKAVIASPYDTDALLSLEGKLHVKSLPSEKGVLIAAGPEVATLTKRAGKEAHDLRVTHLLDATEVLEVDADWGLSFGQPLAAVSYNSSQGKRQAIIDYERWVVRARPGQNKVRNEELEPGDSIEPVVEDFGLENKHRVQVIPLPYRKRKGAIFVVWDADTKRGRISLHIREEDGNQVIETLLPDGVRALPEMEVRQSNSQFTLLVPKGGELIGKRHPMIALHGGEEIAEIKAFVSGAPQEDTAFFGAGMTLLLGESDSVTVLASQRAQPWAEDETFATVVLSNGKIKNRKPEKILVRSLVAAKSVQTVFEGVDPKIPICALRFPVGGGGAPFHMLVDRVSGRTLVLQGAFTFHRLNRRGPPRFLILNKVRRLMGEGVELLAAVYDSGKGEFLYGREGGGYEQYFFKGEHQFPIPLAGIRDELPINVSYDEKLDLIQIRATFEGQHQEGFILFPSTPSEQAEPILGYEAQAPTITYSGSRGEHSKLFVASYLDTVSTSTEASLKQSSASGGPRTSFVLAHRDSILTFHGTFVSGAVIESAQVLDHNRVVARGSVSSDLQTAPVEIRWDANSSDDVDVVINPQSVMYEDLSEGFKIAPTRPLTSPIHAQLVVTDKAAQFRNGRDSIVVPLNPPQLDSVYRKMEGRFSTWLDTLTAGDSIEDIQSIEKVDEDKQLLLIHTGEGSRRVTFLYSRQHSRVMGMLPGYRGRKKLGSKWVWYGEASARFPTIVIFVDPQRHAVEKLFDLGSQKLAAGGDSVRFDRDKGHLIFSLDSGTDRVFALRGGHFVGLLPPEVDREIQEGLDPDSARRFHSFNETIFLNPPEPLYDGRQTQLQQLQAALSLTARQRGDKRRVLVVANRGTGGENLVENLVNGVFSGHSQTDTNIEFLKAEASDFVNDTTLRGQSGNRFDFLLERAEVLKSNGIRLVLVLKGLHEFRGKKDDSENVVQNLKRLLDSPNLDVIAMTTESGKAELLQRERDVLAFFEQEVHLKPMNMADTFKVVKGWLRTRSSGRSRPAISESQLREVVERSSRANYGSNHQSPGREIKLVSSILDSIPPERSFEWADYFQAEARNTGLPAFLYDRENYKTAQGTRKKKVKARVIDQPEPIESVFDALRRYAMGLKSTRGPIYTALFPGPTGVGKTLLARAIAEDVFGDASAYHEVVGGAVKSEADLIEKLERRLLNRPASVIVINEFEKLSSEQQNIILSIGDGAIGQASTSLAIVILTTNLGARQYQRPIGLAEDTVAQANKRARAEIRRALLPEVFNRVEVAFFGPLDRSKIEVIVETLLTKVPDSLKRINALEGVRLEFDRSVVIQLAKTFENADQGMKGLQRHISLTVGNFIALRKSQGKIERGHHYRVHYINGRFQVRKIEKKRK